jgi:hypothetical protein
VPIDHSGVGYRRIAGLYDWLIEQQQAAVVRPDLRALDWSLEDPDAIAADKARLAAEGRANPKRSALLDKLMLGEPAVVAWSALRGRLPADAPEWLPDPRITPCVREYVDDLVEPADGPPDQCSC